MSYEYESQQYKAYIKIISIFQYIHCAIHLFLHPLSLYFCYFCWKFQTSKKYIYCINTSRVWV